jgi:hydroxymethylglutaryl-CoA lyase
LRLTAGKFTNERTKLKINFKMKIIECPRDAMQGLKNFIPTQDKINYINLLLECGFDTIDFGSFVSPKAVPQMRDTGKVLEGLNTHKSSSALLAIVANKRGAEEALRFKQIDYLGYPFSVSETFQQRNTGKSIVDSLKTVKEIHSMCEDAGRSLVIYLSMAFGNPYQDPWEPGIVETWAGKMKDIGISVIALADTSGDALPEDVYRLFETLIAAHGKKVEFGAHFHARPDNWYEKTSAAFDAGCRRFDTAIRGFGGCPMAGDELTGNLATENLLAFLKERNIKTGLKKEMVNKAIQASGSVFG